MVDPPQVVVVHDGVLALERLRAQGQPGQPLVPGPRLTGGQGSVRQPPQEGDAQDDGEEAVHQKHPAEADQAAEAVHLLEAGGHESHHGG